MGNVGPDAVVPGPRGGTGAETWATARSSALRSVGERGRRRLAADSDASSSQRWRATSSSSVPPPVPDATASRGLSADRAARAQRHGLHAPGARQRAVFAFGVDDPGPTPEDGETPQIGLDERALAPPDLSDHHHVGVGERARPVQLEGVIGERGPQQVPSHQHATAARGPTDTETETGLAQKGVDGSEMSGGGLVGGDPP